ncbi:signal peptidase I [Alicyclobacillus macrosporangiidus]|jgi:signal peptidase I|uniref:Signal peptidase I n=1 Tax=Alicyclobacillus macrosporangiidus TaxID=392015 RepID=A0A1I7GDM9_9BACL|nr:signal peptidase I [Alicyclobacillus macrosporangiidus]SFU46554.1 signal peptidase I [Alicyclobacillus macrosporangiidus]
MAETQAKRSVWKELWDWVWPIALGVLIALGIRHWVVDLNRVPSSSMRPTIMDPCLILTNHLATEFGQPYRGEVVVFHFPDDPSKIFVKRIIGMPGDTVTIHDGKVFVNNQPLKEPYLDQPTSGNWGPYHVPDGEYFMLGDNRTVSEDSRYWQNTYVPRSYIIGKAEFVLWPLGAAHRIQ